MIRPQDNPTKIDAIAIKLLTARKHSFQSNYSNQIVDSLMNIEGVPTNTNLMKALDDSKPILMMDKTMSGEWADVVLLKHWLTKAFNKRVAETFSTKSKIINPSVFENAVANVLEAAKILGGITRYKVGQTSGTSAITINWKAQLSGAINNATISGTVEP